MTRNKVYKQLTELADWFDDPKNPERGTPIRLRSHYARISFTAGYLLRRVRELVDDRTIDMENEDASQ